MEKEIQNSINIISQAKKGELAFTTGAGISYPVGIPLVGNIADILLEELELYDSILNEEKDSEEQRRNTYKKFMNLQFESIVSTMVDRLDQTQKTFFDIFDTRKYNYQPAIAHIVLAYLAHLGKISTIATFNIDQLHEDAFEKVFSYFGSNKTLKIYNSTRKQSANSFDKTDWLNLNEIRLLKWHGDIGHRKDLGMTIEQIVGNIQQDSRIESMTRFYSGIPLKNKKDVVNNSVLHNSIGILGSRVGNNFDENIVFKDIKKSTQKIFMVLHRSDEKGYLKSLHKIDDIRNEEFSFNPFKIFHKNSIWENISTEKILDSFYPKKIKLKKTEEISSIVNIRKWIQEQPETLKHLTASDLLRKMGYFNQALDRAEKAEKECPTDIAEYEKPLVITYETQGSLLHLKGLLGDSRKKFNQALNIYSRRNDLVGELKILNDLANIYQTEANYNEAGKIYIEIIEVYKKLPRNNTHRMGKAVSITNLAFVNHQQGSLKEAKRNLKKAETIFKSLGKLGDLAHIYNRYGIWSISIGKTKIAKEFFQKAQNYAEKWGQISALAESLKGQGTIEEKKGKPQIALDFYEKALQIYTTANDKIGINGISTYIANFFRSQGKYQKALNEYEKIEKNSISLESILIQKNNQASVYHAWYTLDKTSEEYLEKALNLYNEVIQKGSSVIDPESMVHSLINRSLIHKNYENFEKAKTDLIQADAIAKKNELIEGLGKILLNIGYLKQVKEKYPEALEKYKEAQNYPLDVETESVLLNNIGRCYEQLGLGLLSTALFNYESAINLGKQSSKYGLLLEYYTGAAYTSKSLGQNIKARKYAIQAYESAKKCEIPNIEPYKQMIKDFPVSKKE